MSLCTEGPSHPWVPPLHPPHTHTRHTQHTCTPHTHIDTAHTHNIHAHHTSHIHTHTHTHTTHTQYTCTPHITYPHTHNTHTQQGSFWHGIHFLTQHLLLPLLHSGLWTILRLMRGILILKIKLETGKWNWRGSISGSELDFHYPITLQIILI